jgi:inner membrane protein
LKFPLLSKAAALLAVSVGLMCALSSVQSVVSERQARQHEAEDSVANSLASSQTLLGPVLTRTCTETWLLGYGDAPERKPIYEQNTYNIRLPAKQIKVNAKVQMTPRYRGMFKVNGYSVGSLMAAQWDDITALNPSPTHERSEMHCDAPTVAIALSDARGIHVAEVTMNGAAAPVLPGTGMSAYPRGFQAVVPDAFIKRGQALNVAINLELAGTQSLAIAPVANTTLVTMNTDWPHPSFGGRFLPSERHIHQRGFEATWKVSSLASTATQEWQKGAKLCGLAVEGDCIESFGVDFIDPINPYVLSDRATKYGLLFIALTFVGVGLVEVLRRLRVHPIQYLLVGAALTVFFLLLVSLSEHVAFGWAYTAASFACTLLLSFYGSFVLRGWKAGLAFGAGIAGLFGTLYALLQMEQSALVLGSVLLFVVLAVVMISTRKLDWYELLGQMREQAV